MKQLASAAAAAILLTLKYGNAAHAAAADEVREAKVPYGDLELASERGRAELNRRVKRAARGVCTPPGEFEFVLVGIACRKAVVKSARQQIQLLKLHSQQSQPPGSGALTFRVR